VIPFSTNNGEVGKGRRRRGRWKTKAERKEKDGECSEPSQNGNPRYATTAYNDEKRFEDNFIHRKQTIEHTINQI